MSQTGEARLGARTIQHLRERISSRGLGPGARLPSIRRLAAELKVSKSTVVEAYERLAAEGVVSPRPGSGFFVASGGVPLSLAAAAPRRERAIDPLWIMRQSLDGPLDTAKPGCGWLPPDWLPDQAIRRGLRSLSRRSAAELAEYDETAGYRPLRQQLAVRLQQQGIPAAPEQVVVTDSGSHALDLICRLLLQPGDAVLIDDPCYFNFQAILQAHRARPIGVTYGPGGPDLEQLAGLAASERPRLYLTNAVLHNPTGVTLPPAAAHRLLSLAEAHDFLIVDDDIFADLEPQPSLRLAALDGLKRVVQIGSFSKTLSAAARCGFVALRQDWVDGLVDLKLATSFGNSALTARLLYQLLADGSYRRHVEALRRQLARAGGEASQRLRSLGFRFPFEARGGMFLWAQLPDGRDSAEVARAALARDVVLAPGNVFSIGQRAGQFLRFNVAQSAEPRIFDVLKAVIAA